MEKESTGLYLSGHPMMEYADAAKKVQAARISDLLEAAQEYSTRYIDNAQVTLLGIVSSMKRKLRRAMQRWPFSRWRICMGRLR